MRGRCHPYNSMLRPRRYFASRDRLSQTTNSPTFYFLPKTRLMNTADIGVVNDSLVRPSRGMASIRSITGGVPADSVTYPEPIRGWP
jgi:hypothetical protein